MRGGLGASAIAIAAMSILAACDRGDSSNATIAPAGTTATNASTPTPSAVAVATPSATAGAAAPSIDPGADTALQGVQLLGLIGELAERDGADCDRFGDALDHLLAQHADLLQAMAKKNASQSLAERKAEDAKYAKEEADFEGRAGPVLTRCAPNPKVQAAMAKIP